MAELLLAHGALPDAKSAAGETPQQVARARGHPGLEARLDRANSQTHARHADPDLTGFER
jgi:hypothetical protein